MRMSVCVGPFPANTLVHSSGDLRSRSASELLLTQKTKLPRLHDGLLKEYPTPCSHDLFELMTVAFKFISENYFLWIYLPMDKTVLAVRLNINPVPIIKLIGLFFPTYS